MPRGPELNTLQRIAWHRILTEYRAERTLRQTPTEAATYLRNLYANVCASQLGNYGPLVAEHARLLWEAADRLHTQVRLSILWRPYWATGRVTFMPPALDCSLVGGE